MRVVDNSSLSTLNDSEWLAVESTHMDPCGGQSIRRPCRTLYAYIFIKLSSLCIWKSLLKYTKCININQIGDLRCLGRGIDPSGAQGLVVKKTSERKRGEETDRSAKEPDADANHARVQ
jgi:hypothetical protein